MSKLHKVVDAIDIDIKDSIYFRERKAFGNTALLFTIFICINSIGLLLLLII